MSNTTQDITVQDVEVQGPFTKKDGEGEYERHIYKSDSGEEYFSFAAVDSEPKLKVGDSVKVVVQTSTYRDTVSNKIVKILESKPQEKRATTQTKSKPGKTTATTTVTTTHKSSNPEREKNVSMEVSGLAQALITGGTQLSDLEDRLRTVLDIKRRVAKDYE